MFAPKFNPRDVDTKNTMRGARTTVLSCNPAPANTREPCLTLLTSGGRAAPPSAHQSPAHSAPARMPLNPASTAHA
jgi:hypothetical protein